MFYPVTVTHKVEDFAVVNQAVQDRGGNDRIL